MNAIWTILTVLSLFTLIFVSPNIIVDTMLNSSKSVVNLSINLISVYSVWLGILEILEKTDLTEKLANFLSPLIKKVFKIENKTQIKYVAVNLSANILGLGNAATPSGIKAVKSMEYDLPKTKFAIFMLVVLNATSLQLFPTTVISLRALYNSKNASDIILPSLISSFVATFISALLLILYFKFKKRTK